MYIIGVTGGVGAGKSTVTRMLSELGAATIDADQLAHEAILPGAAAYQGLLKEFGPSIACPGGAIDRRRLAELAFAGAETWRRLNEIVHPPVIEILHQHLRAFAAAGQGVVAIDVPLLYESGLDRLCDQVWVVRAQPAVRRRRLERRSGPAAAGMIEREAWLIPLRDKVKRADAVIDTSFGFKRTRAQVLRLWQALPAGTAKD